ncbi:NUDIX hydrolase [Planomonospora venezuelensis]|uniref:8-oxo-dGTP diphosphatase n=1 Tax=Planomonospora venezuelensis TaxID=1999 RepID=A0A841D2T7_PLAVE|nr:NUDIX hydrolase [Planomonospora venezuelensis]MBB5962708.1 8-oxo-dGTP diphosphatase [Planomonospora venezuelensis]GIN01643.1 putative hydrolase MutT/NUDIX [Planomonospora venezuelensis]
MTDLDVRPAGMIRAAGAVLWRGPESAPEIALVHRPKYDDWTFPKGKLKPGEHVIGGALREVAEETGITAVLGRSLPPVHYMKGRRLKRVDYWLARAVSGEPYTAVEEVDEVAWLPLEEARRRLTYEWDAGLLRALAAFPLATTPLLLVRHGSAGSRQEWRGDDDLRPLDGTGAAQAEVLAEALYGYRPAELVSSPSLRCVQTLEPYAARAGLEIRRERLLAETGHDPRASLRLLHEALAADRAAVLCSHGKVLPGLIKKVIGRPGDAHLRKGAFLVLHHAGGRVVGMDRYTT